MSMRKYRWLECLLKHLMEDSISMHGVGELWRKYQLLLATFLWKYIRISILFATYRYLDINMHVAGSLCFGKETRYMGKTHMVDDLEPFKRS